MNTFALDLWHDLREKRLWPVAVLLAVVILALPLLLLKGGDSDSGGPAAAPGATASTAGDPTSKEARAGEANLDRAHPKNPFRSTEAKSTGAATGFGGAGGSSAPSSGSHTVVGGTGGGSTSSGSTGSGSTGGGSTSGGSTGGGAPGGLSTGLPTPTTGSGSGSDQTKIITKSRTLVAYKYTADLEFGLRGQKLTRRTSVDQLQALPGGEHPLMIFLGVTADGRRAVFGLAPSLAQAGEGSCRPTRTRCTFLSLRTDAAHNVHGLRTPDGKVYVVRVRGINRERLRKLADSSAGALPALAAGVDG